MARIQPPAARGGGEGGDLLDVYLAGTSAGEGLVPRLPREGQDAQRGRLVIVNPSVIAEIEANGGVLPKARWGRGPWQREPDMLEWRHAGFHCGALRAEVTGSWCGYVGVSGDHPVFGKGPWECILACNRDPAPRFSSSPFGEAMASIARRLDIPHSSCEHTVSTLFDVHGGITYSGPRPFDPDLWWLGFDCSHFGDYSPAMEALTALVMPPEHTERKRRYRQAGWFHERYRSLAYVRRETNRLAEQLRTRSTHAGRWPWPTYLAAVAGLPS
jgi:hypothetical protein